MVGGLLEGRSRSQRRQYTGDYETSSRYQPALNTPRSLGRVFAMFCGADEALDSSDLDVLVEFKGKVTFDRYMDLKFYLEDLLGVSVDVVTKKILRDEIQATVEQEAIRVAQCSALWQ
jgi:predicted nucleotidyltransferase